MKPGDPTVAVLEFHSSGKMRIQCTTPDGTLRTFDYDHTEPDKPLVVMSANPGGSGLLDSEGMHDRSERKGAYFEIEVRRVF